jgi:hypothetical protein
MGPHPAPAWSIARSLALAPAWLLCACPTSAGPIEAPADDDSAGPGADDDDSPTPAPDDDDTTAPPDDDDATTPPGDDDDATTPPGPPTWESCFGWQSPVVDYASSGAILGPSCLATDHQEIADVEHVVFVGDSVTVGTPPTATGDWYRNLVAAELANAFFLDAPASDWENVDLVDGVTYVQDSGDFSSCAKWGARTDDLYQPPHQQLQTCMPEAVRGQRTLVIMTMGGNDLMSMLQDFRDGVDQVTLEDQWIQALADYSEAIHWLKDDPSLFPAGIDVVLANIFDVTDAAAAADIAECPGAGWIGLDEPLYDPFVHELGVMWQEATLELAVETGSDMVFMGEAFCGHGYAQTASSRCWRGSGAANYFDDTCAHPSAAGHAAIAEGMLAAVND